MQPLQLVEGQAEFDIVSWKRAPSIIPSVRDRNDLLDSTVIRKFRRRNEVVIFT